MNYPRMIVGIGGGTASGKTTFAHRLQEALSADRVAILRTDFYYICRSDVPKADRLKFNFDAPDAIEADELVEHLRAMRAGRSCEIPQYCFVTHTRQPSIPFPLREVLIVEGILTLHYREVRECLHRSIFVDADDDLRFHRRLERDVRDRGRTPESVTSQWERTVQPMYEQYCHPSKDHADLVVTPDNFDSTLRSVVEELTDILSHDD